MSAVLARVTETGGREATTRHIRPKLALAVGMPSAIPPRGWRWTALTSLARLESGHTPSRRHPEYWSGAIPWISIADAKAHDGRRIDDTFEHTNDLGIDNSSARLLPENTVCLSRTASLGYVVVMGRPMATSQDFVNWVCGNELDHNFLKYLFIAEGGNLLRFSSGAVHQTIYFPEVKAFHICHPSVTEQQRIVRVLDEAITSLAIAKTNAERNLRNSRALFESHLQSAFKKSSATWLKTTIGECTRFIDYRGKTPAKTQTGLRLITAKNVKMGYIQETPLEFVAPSSYTKWMTRGIPKRGDVLFTTEAPLANVAQLDTDEKVVFAQRVIIMQPDPSALDAAFLKYLLLSPSMQDRIRTRATGATVQGIKASLLKAVEIAFPRSITEQRRIVAKLDALRLETARLASIYMRKVDGLNELRTALLQQAFRGAL